MSPTEFVVATSSMLICHYWSPYLSERETVLEAELTGLGLWKIKYRRISTIRIMTLTGTSSSTLGLIIWKGLWSEDLLEIHSNNAL
jgi:ABC-type Fe3+-siderophore transport system permease subunit